MFIISSPSYEKAFSIAAKELADFYEKITDKKAVLAEVIPPSGDAIHLCPAGSEGADPRVKVGSDEFSLLSAKKENRTLLTITAGRGRASLYGVYAFLERYIGFKCFTKDIERFDKVDTLAVEDLDIRENPAFEYREVYFRSAFDSEFCVKNRLNSNMAYIPKEKGGKLKFYNFH